MSSLSASAENLTNDNQNCDSSTMCLELALEGERLCKAGDCRAGVAFFQAAIQAGTDDLRTLSAIYSQLGNAYFYLGDYNQAMQYHKLDLTIARTMGDKLGEAKSSGNLGNTLKVMGRFQEAALCCERHLSIARELGDRPSEGRALYNLGNVYHAQGKHLGHRGSDTDLEDASDEVRTCLEQAVKYYQENLTLMRELSDNAAQGRACGNLGNTLYLLGDFVGAIEHHTQRLNIAKQFGDKQAERRAHSNLGNSHIFLGEFEAAALHYKKTLVLAQELGERAVEAQACYSLGNTHTLLRDYPAAVDYHQRHLAIAQQLGDRVGEARAAWSLGNAHTALSNHEKALYYASQHLELSKELGDSVGEATATLNVQDLKRVLGMDDSVTQVEALKLADEVHKEAVPVSVILTAPPAPISRMQRVRRQSMEQLDLIKLTPDGKQRAAETNGAAKPDTKPPILPKLKSKKLKAGMEEEEESFFDLLTKFQSERMDDQRCSLQVGDNKENVQRRAQANSNTTRPKQPSRNPDELFDLIEGLQGKRMDEQRVSLPHLPGLQPTARTVRNNLNNANTSQPDDNFLEMLMRCQGSRIEEQRSALPATTDWEGEGDIRRNQAPNNNRGATVPDEDFFSLILRVQGGRMDDQRASVKRL